jgi:hypothetical protein
MAINALSSGARAAGENYEASRGRSDDNHRRCHLDAPIHLRLSQYEAQKWSLGEVVEMTCIASLLEGICPEIEQQLKPNLRGIKGLLVRSYLPQIWAFETESETVILTVDAQGKASISNTPKYPKDVTIRWKHDSLASALRSRSSAHVPRGERPIIMFHTRKGRAGFDFLRKRVGL